MDKISWANGAVGANAVATAKIAIVNRYLAPPSADPADLEATLVAFAVDWHTPIRGYGEHRALVEQIRSEVGRALTSITVEVLGFAA
jgi:hypothetical protein